MDFKDSATFQSEVTPRAIKNAAERKIGLIRNLFRGNIPGAASHALMHS
jgi:hypothetical protein